MKHLRTLVTLLLVLTMVVSSIGVFAEESSVAESVDTNAKFSDIEAGSKTEAAVTKLVAHNIISGYPDGTFKPDGQITRAEFAAVITRFEGIAQNLGADAVTGFADLDNDTQNAWARPYVKAAVDAGIINGFDDGTFRAGEPVTYEQAIKMIICAIDYEIVANSELAKLQATNVANITWSSGYIAAANKNNITVGAMTANVTGPATRGTVAILTSNALDAPSLTVKDDGSVEKVDPEDEEKKLTELDGIVTGTYYTGLDEQNPDVSNVQLRIRANREEEAYDLADNVLKTVDFEDIIGKRVVAYYDNYERVITSLSVASNNDVTLIEEAMVDRPINGSLIRYETKNGRTESVSLSDYTILWNGKYVESLPNMESNFRNGTIELVEAPGSKVAKITSYDVFVVNSYDKTNSKIYFKYGKTYNGNNFYQFPAKTSDKPEIFVNGQKKEFSALSLSAYNVINYMESPAGAEGQAIRKMYVTTAAKSGKVTAKLGEEREVELNEQTLYLTNDYADYTPQAGDEEKAPFENGESYSYYLDYTGQIAAIKYSAASAGSYKYGYIVTVGEDDSQYIVRLITETGADMKYPLKSNVKVDGEKTPDDAVFDALEISATTANAAYNNVFTGTSLTYAQPVRYMLSGNSIEAIDTVLTNAGGSADNFTYDVKLSDGQTNATRTTLKNNGTSYSVNSSTIVLYVPDDRRATDDYSKMSPSTAFSIATNRHIEIFNVDTSTASKTAKFVLVFGSDPTLNFVGASPYMLVTGKGYSNGKDVLKGFVSAGTTESEVPVSEDKFKTGLSSNSVTYDDVDEGDVVRYLKDSSGNIIAIEMVYDADNHSSGSNKGGIDSTTANGRKYSDRTGSSYFHVTYGDVVSMVNEEDIKTITVSYVLASDNVSDHDYLSSAYTFNAKNSKVYEISNGEVTLLETFDTIHDMDTQTPSRVVVISNDIDSDASSRVIYLLN